MRKPVFGDNGSGMHCHQSIWENGKPLFYDETGYAQLSDLARWYIGGLLAHAPALLAFTNPTLNSYHRLVPGFDPWVFGPGTSDTRLIAPERRALATKGSNLVIRGGIVTGTWRIRGSDLAVSWFDESGPAPAAELEHEAQRLSHLQGQKLQLSPTRS